MERSPYHIKVRAQHGRHKQTCLRSITRAHHALVGRDVLELEKGGAF